MKSPMKALALFLVACQVGFVPMAEAAKPTKTMGKNTKHMQSPRVDTAATGEAPKSCKGLESSKGNFVDNLRKREKIQDNYCKSEQMKGALDGVRQKLKPCEEVSQFISNPKLGVQGEDLDRIFQDLKRRVERACLVHKNYVYSSNTICKAYGEASQIKLMDGNGQSLSQEKVAKIYGDASRQYKLFGDRMEAEHKSIKKNVEGLGEGKDEEMELAFQRVRVYISPRISHIRKEISQKASKRFSVDGGEGSSAIRIKTKDDAKKAWEKIVMCEAALKDQGKGGLAFTEKDYQANLGRSLADAKAESSDLATKFHADSEGYARAQAEATKNAEVSRAAASYEDRKAARDAGIREEIAMEEAEKERDHDERVREARVADAVAEAKSEEEDRRALDKEVATRGKYGVREGELLIKSSGSREQAEGWLAYKGAKPVSVDYKGQPYMMYKVPGKVFGYTYYFLPAKK